MNKMILKSSPTSKPQNDQLILHLQREVDTLRNRVSSLEEMMRQMTIVEAGIVSKEYETYHKENERKKEKKELKKKEECEALEVGEYMIITGGTKGVIGDIVYSTKVTKKSVHVVDTKGENFLKRKVHLKKIK